MTGVREQGLGLRVREALEEMGAAVPAEVADKLGLAKEDRLGRIEVRNILRGLKKGGGAKQNPLGQYSLVHDPERKGAVQGRIWRACCLKAQKGQSFCLGDLAQIVSGEKSERAVSRDYLKRYVQFLCREGYLVESGRIARAAFYRVVPGKEREAAPVWNRRAEKRRGTGASQGSGVRDQEDHRPQACATEIPPGPPFSKGGERPAGGTPAPPEGKGKTILQAAFESATLCCDLLGGQCIIFPQGCDLCPIWATLRLEIQPMPILNCDCPGADCAACAEMEAAPADPVTAFWTGMEKFLSGLQDTMAMGVAHLEQTQEILNEMEREVAAFAGRAGYAGAQDSDHK